MSISINWSHVGEFLQKSPHYAAKVQSRIDDVEDNLGSFAQYAQYVLRPMTEAGLFPITDHHPAEVARMIFLSAPNPADVDTTEP